MANLIDIKKTIPISRGEGVYDFEMPETTQKTVSNVSNITETKKLLLSRKYKKQYVLYFLFTILDFKQPLSKEEYILSKLSKHQEISEKRQKKDREKTEKRQRKGKEKTENKLLLMQKIRKSKAKNEAKQRLIKYEKVVNYIRSNKSLMSRKIKIKYKYISYENRLLKVISEGSYGYLSRTEVNHILKQSGTEKPNSQNGMTSLVLLVQQTEKQRKIKEQLNKILNWLWKW